MSTNKNERDITDRLDTLQAHITALHVFVQTIIGAAPNRGELLAVAERALQHAARQPSKNPTTHAYAMDLAQNILDAYRRNPPPPDVH